MNGVGVNCCIGLGIAWSAELRTLSVAGIAYFAGRLCLSPRVYVRLEYAPYATSETLRSPGTVAGAGRFSRAQGSNADKFLLPEPAQRGTFAPGFMMLFGSNIRFMLRISWISVRLRYLSTFVILVLPMPCSPVMTPPTSTAAL